MRGQGFTSITRTTGRREPGIALLVVLLLIAVIAAFVFEFCYEARLKYQLAENTLRSDQALSCAEAGLALAVAALEQNDDPGADEKLARILSGAASVSVGPGSCTTLVLEERGKINVNGLVTRAGKPDPHRIDQMLRLLDVLNAERGDREPIRYSLIPAIIDWIDPDSEVTVLSEVRGANAGAEEQYYQSLEKPYHCQNGPLEVLSELLLVKGMTRATFSGGSNADETGPGTGLGEYLTVYGDGLVSLNDASPIVLQTLSPQIDPVLADEIVRHRPYRRVGDLAAVPGMTPEVLQAVQGLVTTQPGGEYYTVTARGVVGDCVRTVRLAVRKDLRQGSVTPLIRWEM